MQAMDKFKTQKFYYLLQIRIKAYKHYTPKIMNNTLFHEHQNIKNTKNKIIF